MQHSTNSPSFYESNFISFLLNFLKIGLVSLSIAVILNVAVSPANAQPVREFDYAGMSWRVVGPFRAGWATVVRGIPDQPETYYFGGAGGGIWKTNNAGRTWEPSMQHKQSSAIGALAIAPSDPHRMYAGTGQVTIRYDNMAGDGVYRSDDGGKTWHNMGLKETRHIGDILVDPHNPDRVLVAALGHIFDDNPERGIYLSNDGGKTWKLVLHTDNKTGAVDFARDPEHPSVIYAAMWQMHMHPWLDYFQPQGGPGSAIYKSTDGGTSWHKLKARGLPDAPLGRIGLGVARKSNAETVFATVTTPGKGNGFYRSDDGGQSWKLLNDDPELASDYFCRITVAPDNPDVVYVTGRSLHRSDDGGHHFTIVKGSPGGDDYHDMWINPKYPDHMITGADQGAAVSVDSGKMWSSWYNQPTGQFYHLAADNRFPYHIYSGQQDNGTVQIKSRGPYGVIEERDWHPVGGDERDYMVPKPGNPDIVFGSGLGGYVSQFHEDTRQSASVSPWPVSTYGARLNKVKYRYTWITPLVFSPIGKHSMYLGSQVLFKSNDDGDHWEVISSDLSAKKPGTTGCEDPGPAHARDCGFGVIYSIAPSPLQEDMIWVGTDDGLIQLTRDGGKHWKNITPPEIPDWGRINSISPSSFDKNTAYVDVDLHRIGSYAPMILKTTDAGAHWKNISNGLPENEFTSAVRADPKQLGLLYAGTDRSVYVSFNDGATWKPLSLNFPTTWVRDLLVHHGDLIAATQGRGIWTLDDLEPLRELAQHAVTDHLHLFKPARSWRMRADENHDTPPPPSTPLGKNPPTGAIIDYTIPNEASGPVTLTIKDAEGNIIRRYSSDDQEEELPATRYFQKSWLGKAPHISDKAGMHRFVWDLRYPRPEALSYNYSIAAVWHDGTPIVPEGPLVLPGRYTVTISANGKSLTQPLTVQLDPRVHVSMQDLRDQLGLAQSVDSTLGRTVHLYKTIEKARKEETSKAMRDSLDQITKKGTPSLSSLAGVLTSLSHKVQSADAAPNQGQEEVYKEYKQELTKLTGRWEKLKQNL